MNGVTPDPSDPIRDGDALSRLKLTQALDRAIYAIAWERAWPHLARVLTVVGLFLVVSWAGLWLALPSVIRAIGLVVFAGAAIAALVPAIGPLRDPMQAYCDVLEQKWFLSEAAGHDVGLDAAMTAYLALGAPAPEAGTTLADSSIALDIDWSSGFDRDEEA